MMNLTELKWDGKERLNDYVFLDRHSDPQAALHQRQQAQKWLDGLSAEPLALKTLRWLSVGAKHSGISRHRLIWLRLRLRFQATFQMSGSTLRRFASSLRHFCL